MLSDSIYKNAKPEDKLYNLAECDWVGEEVITAPGFRVIARTILDEVSTFRPDLIEHQLAHAVSAPTLKNRGNGATAKR